MNVVVAEYNLQNIFAPFAICLTIESREIIITVINAEFVALQTMRNIDTAMFVTRVLLTLEREINRTFAERMRSIMSVPCAWKIYFIR
jgi:ArsR family metal-binding transcriptional regulator